MYVFLVLFTIFAFIMKGFKPKLQNIFFYQKYLHLGENTQRTVVHAHVNVFL